ncbi:MULTISPECIES: class I SAM-dependent methyltransferase [unclassified Lysinibacillus]|jgi:predicted methyltransferase|uniref:class I SAM-dependent methyltransferase n=1 Tax=unclassified Lysinibacillus TaxID=2636778 RepID=UPI000882F650|nr:MULTISPECIES: class I SAM-dependent methyltransferase [unclassified Lysinibacillus]WCH46849.1 methyltransferase domain-containing protein [Lysinibacillus sp. OF-1]SCZ02335.1 Putative rRNA methylase [Lysinibacillus sp. SG9]SDB28080.1 Putative rRNA methylase [Lysinibacillus sp. TC-37]SFS88566.1 Putative rRNA methylase [Lysinibacillus sp. SG55]
MKLQRVLQYAQQLLKDSIDEGDTVVDATAGNGHDTLFLAQLVGDNGQVYAFDVQKEAVDATLLRLLDHGLEHRALVLNKGHEDVAQYVHKPVAAAIFNLGYLPGSNHDIITKPATTTQAIEELLKLLKVGGLIILVIYHGHPGGKEERDTVMDYVSRLPQKHVHVLKYEFLNQQNDPPFVIALEKMKEFPI